MFINSLPAVFSIVAPPPIGAALTAFQCLFCCRGLLEIVYPMKYSKFTAENIMSQFGSVSSNVGMLIIYLPALLTCLHFMAFFPHGNALVSMLLFIHFAKRVLEVLTLHDFSGSKGMPARDALVISSYYTFASYMIASYAVPRDLTNPIVEMLGLAAFVIGEAGNFYHHWLLKKLKEQRLKNGRRYVPPNGGLFELVAAPHYLFEVIAWVGLALVAQQFNAYLEIVSSLGYLMVRSKRTNDMYFNMFSKKEWPRNRKNLIPYLF